MSALMKMFVLALVSLFAVVVTGQRAQSIVSFDINSPSYLPLPLNRYTGVVLVEIDGTPCSGSLLKGGYYILTAAHCLNEGGVELPGETEISATFKLPRGEVTIPVTDYFIHPDWTGYTSEVGNDLAILELENKAPRQAEQYDIYRQSNEIGQIFTKVGYGYIGIGAKGQDLESNADSQRYAGKNRYDALGDILQDSEITDYSELVLGSQLLFDFDNGKPKNDALGRHFPNLADRGIGREESATASGDSGGPSFIGGKIAGVSSWGSGDRELFTTNRADIDRDDLNSSFGEIFGDARVSFYADWIDSIVGDR